MDGEYLFSLYHEITNLLPELDIDRDDFGTAFVRQRTTISWLKRVVRDVRILRRKIVGFKFEFPDFGVLEIKEIIPQPGRAAYVGPKILVWAEVHHPDYVLDINLETMIVLMAYVDILNERDPTMTNYRPIAKEFRRYIQSKRQNWQDAVRAMGNDRTCAICLHEITEDDFYHVNCSRTGHVYHKSCWLDWGRLVCPRCNIPARQYKRKSTKSKKSRKSRKQRKSKKWKGK